MANPTTKIKKMRRVKPVLVLMLILLVSVSLIISAMMTQIGAQCALGFLGRFAGIEFQEIRGSLMEPITIKHLALRNKAMQLGADDVEIQWQPKALLGGQLLLDSVHVNSVQLVLEPGDDKPLTLPKSLALPLSIKLVASINALQISQASGKPQEFSALKANVQIDSRKYQLQFSGTTPWGNATIHGDINTAAPFATKAQFDWQGLAVQQNGVSLPATTMKGDVSGTLSKLLVQANATSDQTRGQIHVVATPFSILPVDTLQADLTSVNPANFYATAPKANLHIAANFKASGDTKSPALIGQLSIKNTTPSAWNAGGIPIANVSSEVTVDEHKLAWRATKVELGDDGIATSAGEFNFSTSDSIPHVTATIDLKNVNALRIDSRLKKTQLTGKIQIARVATGLQFGIHAQDVQAKLIADMELSPAYVMQFKKIALQANDAIVGVQGSLALRDKQEFSVKGEMQNFNPARWVDVPSGRIATHVTLAGQLQQGWRVDAQVHDLSGQFAGMELKGESNVVAQEGKLATVKKLELTWGENILSAKGNMTMGESAGGSKLPQQLQLKLVVPDLVRLSRPFKNFTNEMSGAIFADGTLSGNFSQPSGQLNVRANKVVIPDVIELDKLQASINVGAGSQGQIEGNADLTGLLTGGTKIDRVQASLNGLRHAHQLHVIATLPRKYQVDFLATGELKKTSQWIGQIQKLDLTGPQDLTLTKPVDIQVSSKEVKMREANWQGKLGRLQVQQIDWSPGQLKTSGQLIGLPVSNALRLIRSSLPLIGDLQVDANWQIDIGRQVAGQIDIKRTSGDISVQDITVGHSQTSALGLKSLSVKASIGQVGSNAKFSSLFNQPISVQLQAQGDQLGTVEANLGSVIKKSNQGWAMAANAPISGAATMRMNEIQWMSAWAGSGVSVQGALQAQARLSGTRDKPDYSVKVSGQNLDVSLTELGVLLPHGTLEASLESGAKLKLEKLTFSQTIKAPPKNERLASLAWLNETGYVTSSGEIDLQSGRGAIATHWQRFPFLQKADGWLVASGDAQLTGTQKTWNLTGQLLADAAYFSVPKQAVPKLSSDVIVLKKNDKLEQDKSTGMQSNVDFLIKTGSNFVFVGRGLNTNLHGELRLRITNDGPVFASGSIQTEGGTYDGYGQKLSIERGILNFQGALDNPGLNVRALRRGLPVEAGVEIVGTVVKPEVRLISEPNVPDQDKLSWLVLGRGLDQTGGADASLLIAAGSAILGGDSSSNISSTIAQKFGLDDISVNTVGGASESQLPSQTVAGNIGNNALNDQVFSVGKRITPDLVLSVERSLTEATNGIKLTWKLTRRFSIIGRAGTDNSLDGQYLFSFN